MRSLLKRIRHAGLLKNVNRSNPFVNSLWNCMLRSVTPIEGIIHKKHLPNNSVTITINTACNINCLNCYVIDKTNGEMRLEQIDKFISEALTLGYHWNVLELRGGETTLHPLFFDILKSIKPYKVKNPDCQILVLTNGVGPKVNRIISEIPGWVCVYNAHKDKSRNIYDNFWTFASAPIDSYQYNIFTDFSKGCRLISSCYGLCLSKYGFYPCSPCVEVDKIFEFDVGIKQLSDVNEKALRNQMKTLCRYCGLFREPARFSTRETWSKSWQKAYEDRQQKTTELSIY